MPGGCAGAEIWGGVSAVAPLLPSSQEDRLVLTMSLSLGACTRLVLQSESDDPCPCPDDPCPLCAQSLSLQGWGHPCLNVGLVCSVSTRRSLAGAHWCPGAGHRGAGPDPAPGGGGAGDRGRVAGTGQRLLTRPRVSLKRLRSSTWCRTEPLEFVLELQVLNMSS